MARLKQTPAESRSALISELERLLNLLKRGDDVAFYNLTGDMEVCRGFEQGGQSWQHAHTGVCRLEMEIEFTDAVMAARYAERTAKWVRREALEPAVMPLNGTDGA